MKAIHADPKEIRKIFSEKYIIPDFQRPYSWDNEPCEKLWDDIIDFYESKESREDKYFLGNIVIHQSNDAYVVIDGQQRLTTLLLLIKDFHSRAGTVKALEECLRIKDPLTSELTNELRVNSLVFDGDKETLYDIIFNNGTNSRKCNLVENYKFFGDKIDEWWRSKGSTADALNNLILALLDNIVLLPIHCGSEDDALTIFETINNRGMSLSDADIFKAKLYHFTEEPKKSEFITAWNNLENHDWLFRILMHIIRAQRKDSSKEIALRSFFTSKSNHLANCDSIMRSLKTVYEIDNKWYGSDDINILWAIMKTYPNYYWNYPLFVFLHKYGHVDNNSDSFVLPDEYLKKFTELLIETAKYFFIKGVVHNSVNAVKDTVFRVCVQIESEGKYLGEYRANLQRNDRTEFLAKLDSNQLGRYQRGIILLASYLNPNQDKEKFSELLSNAYDLEHILPRKWNNYDGWTEETWYEQLNTLGNLIPLEKKLNISAKNEFFDRKKIEYKKSNVQDAIDLLSLVDWTPTAVDEKQTEKLDRLYDFFEVN